MSSGSREHKTGRQKSQWSDCCGARCQRFFFDKYCLLSFALLGWNCQEGHQISCCWSLTYEEVDTMTQVFNVKAWKRFWREASTPTNFFFLRPQLDSFFFALLHATTMNGLNVTLLTNWLLATVFLIICQSFSSMPFFVVFFLPLSLQFSNT